ncbi:DNA polymerase III subunit gamma/tau [Shewanella woodyi]|uniref:DNA-directed DNA polymerase n=1 Tax=Shewanella woodyi (strain ATCC 51908 / MS32) TaxID=392500 RepID=B1KNK0_SHEWM|nr:DNA polymerase III subunit gamma/tau [Shewanella woodyi]ACA86077.1 DNA polymerase III, subunits gamma and tau [Shewanella woodyi ATCC 51908]
MSYQVLARKWRPATFEQMVGQSHVLHALTNALTQQRLHHAYLFSGTRGVGKTSLARLFAKGLNCEQGVTATPCGQCSSCVEISEGRFVDLIEVDAASRTKVDDTRELLDNVQYRPSRGRFKVYLIDEVHMLSRSSFNALLKTLEEPPEHVKFLLATTDPQRLPVTVLSRCLQFNLKSLTQDEIIQQLSHVLTQESLVFENQALTLLAKAANGSMRDALSLTDQAIAFGGGEVRLKQVQTMLGSIDERHVITLFNAITQGDIEHLMQVISQVLSFGADPEEVLRSLLELLHQITLSQFAPAAAQLSIYSEQISAFAIQLSPEQVQLYYQLLLTGRKDLPHAPDPKSGLEMALLRAVSFVPEVPVKRWIVDKPATISVPDVNDAKPSAHAVEATQISTPLTTNAAIPPAESLDGIGDIESPELKLQKESEPATEFGSTSDSADHSAKENVPVLASASDEPEESDDQDADLESLNSEQTLILSQAASQGMEQESTDSTELQASVDVKEAEVVPESTQSQSEVIPERTESAVEISSESSDSDPNVVPDEYYAQAAQFDAQNEYQEQFHEDYSDPYSEDTAEQGAYSTPEPSAESHESRSAEISAADGPEEDDILDAVLAARDSLLTQLSADKPKESDGKKSDPQRKEFVPPKRQAPVAEPQEPIQSEDNQTAHQAEHQADKSDGDETGENEVDVNVADNEDRPPWEEPLTPSVEETLSDATPNVEDLESESTQASELEESVSEPEDKMLAAEISLADDGSVSGNEVDLKWYRLMSALDVGGRVRQLAVNSVCHHFIEPLALLLKPNQKHLAADIAITQLEEALGRALDKEVNIAVSVGSDTTRETPLEIRQRFHRELLSQAHQGLMSDTHIQWLMAEMDAEFETDSLSYSPELLSLKGNTIELIDKSNFKSLPES